MCGRTRNRSASLVIALAFLAFSVAPPFVSAPFRGASATAAKPTRGPGVAGLSRDLDRILSDPQLHAAQAGVVVRSAKTGKLLYSRNGDQVLLPASNEKLLTATAALKLLGSDYRFSTSVLTDGLPSGAILPANLYLRGTGDPTMLAADYDELAAKVAATGIKFVKGNLVADDTWFDDVRLGNDWTWDDEAYPYAAQVSALTVSPNEDFDAGTVIVEVGPGEGPGKPARVHLMPETDYLTVVNQTVTSQGSGPSVSVDRRHGTNTLVVAGSVPVDGGPVRIWASVWEPTGYAAALFRKTLLDHGVRVQGSTSSGATPGNAQELAHRESMPLAELLIPFLKLSNNGHAEILVKAMGRKIQDKGSWGAGLEVVSKFLADMGLNTGLMRIRDGSGLSRVNMVPPDQVTKLLMAVQHEEWFSVWYEALPIAGEPDPLVGGTLRSARRSALFRGTW